jgi:hypothetical protein
MDGRAITSGNVDLTAHSWFVDVVEGLAAKYGLPDDIVIESGLKADPVYAKISHG